MPALLLSSVPIELKAAKTNGLADLGVPLVEGTAVKKGKLTEFMQPQDSGKVGRRFQNIRVTAVKTVEGGVESSKVIVVFEAFGDDNVPAVVNQGVAATLAAGGKTLLELPLGPLFLPYAFAWYENRFAADIGNDVFDQIDSFSFVAKADEVRAI